MKKYAVFTMDVEAFSDTECISATGRQVDVDLMDGLDEYIRILDKNGIKSTLFTVGQFAPKIADRIREYKGYVPVVIDDAASGKAQVLPESDFDFGTHLKRHGGVVGISEDTYHRLLQG